MKNLGKILVVILVALILFLIFPFSISLKKNNEVSHFGDDDQSYALAALEDLDKGMLENRIPEVNHYYLSQNSNNIQLIKQRQEDANDAAAANGEAGPGIEGLSFFNPVNTDYWPYYYYSTPYQYRDGGAWPPGMQSRLYNWQPGFATSGWSYWLRPGITYDRWPRNRWLKNNGNFYFMNNGSEQDRLKDYTGEPS